jgi:very-short-patch-repair endonuclease
VENAFDQAEILEVFDLRALEDQLERNAHHPAAARMRAVMVEPPIQVDFLRRTQRVALETDGFWFHRTQRSFERDRRRDQRLTVAAWRPVRTTWRQVIDWSGQLGALILTLLRS